MAITVPTTATVARLQILFTGFAPGAKEETATEVALIDGAYDNTELTTFFTNLQAVSRAGLVKLVASKEFIAAGQIKTRTSDDATSQVNNQILLTFTQPNPLNSEKTISKSFFVPAPASALLVDSPFTIASVAGDSSSVDEKLRAMVDFLEDNLAYQAADLSWTIGGWTFDIGHSAYIAKPSILDGE